MKYVITEDKFKNFLKKRFGVDLTGNIKIITSARDLSDSFGRFINPNNINKYLNMFGPMFLFDVDDNKYLYHDRGERTWITDINSTFYTEAQLLYKLGLPNIGISIDDIINGYLSEDINESLSRYDEYQIRWRKFEMFMKRRDDMIKDLISQHSHPYSYDPERYDDYVIVNAVVDMVAEDFVVENGLNDVDSYEYDWVHEYLKDNYSDYIKNQIGI